jgi:hypothetical protein
MYFLVLLGSWPGGLQADFYGIVGDFFKDNMISDRHPLMDNLFRIYTLKLGKIWFNSYSAGLLMQSLIQMTVLSAIYAYLCKKFADIKAPPLLQICAVLFYAIHPFNSIFASAATKDSLFSAFCALLVFYLFLAAHRTNPLKNKCFVRKIMAIIILMILWRLNGFAAFVILVPFLFIFLGQKKNLRKLIFISAVPLILYPLYIGPFHDYIHIYRYHNGISLSVPMQQIARVVRDNPSVLTPEENQQILEFIPNPEKYLPHFADALCWNNFRYPPGKFVKDFLLLWYKIGKKCPGIYTNAFLEHSLAMWYPDMVSNHVLLFITDFGHVNANLNITIESKLPAITKLKDDITDTKFQDIPILAMLFSPGFSLWCTVFYAAVCVYYRRYSLLLPAIFLMALAFTHMAGPSIMIRYCFPIFASLPVLCAIVMRKEFFTPENDIL